MKNNITHLEKRIIIGLILLISVVVISISSASDSYSINYIRPDSSVEVVHNTSYMSWDAMWNQIVDVVWTVDGDIVQINNSVLSSTYVNSTPVTGIHTVIANGSNDLGYATQSWTWIVNNKVMISKPEYVSISIS